MDKEKLTKAEIIKDIYEAMDPERGRLNRDDIHQVLLGNQERPCRGQNH